MVSDCEVLLGLWTRLNRTENDAELLGDLPAEICRCAFDRAAVTSVRERVGEIVAAHDVRGPAASSELLSALAETQISLAGLPEEVAMLRTHEPVLVRQIEGVQGPLARVSLAVGASSYVAAPVVSLGEIVALLHADRPADSAPLDERDRDRLGLVAVLAGRVIEQRARLGRIGSLRSNMRRAQASMAAVLTDHLNAPVDLSASVSLEDVALMSAMSGITAPEANPVLGLTRREREVMNQVAAGLTNGEIAAELVISEQTVSSHVKRILRKLRAANRAEAVAKWAALGAGHHSMPSGPSSAPARN